MKQNAIFFPDIPFEQLYIPHILKEIYIERVYDIVLKDKKDLTIVDIGANIGLVTMFLRNYAKKLYAVEPEPTNFDALRKNKEFSNWDNVTIFNCAISDHNGTGDLAINVDNKTMHTLIVDPQKTEDGRYVTNEAMRGRKVLLGGTVYVDKINVQLKTMDTFFTENNITHVDFMKFDVEGAEDMILYSEGFSKVAPIIDNILVEFHFENWKETAQHVYNMGFEARKYDTDANIILFVKR